MNTTYEFPPAQPHLAKLLEDFWGNGSSGRFPPNLLRKALLDGITYHWNRFPQNPPRALQDGVGLVGIHTLYSYFWVGLKSFKAENATAFDQFESNWSEYLSACCATAAQGGHQTCAKIKSVPLEPFI